MRIEIWRTTMQDEVRLREILRLEQELEERATRQAEGAALRKLRRVMKHMIRGDLAMRRRETGLPGLVGVKMALISVGMASIGGNSR